MLHCIITLGAGTACLACLFLLFRLAGMPGAVFVAAMISAAVALGALLAHRGGRRRPAVGPAPAADLMATERSAATAPEASGSMVTIEAPMVGTFYRASSPTAEPYVHEGDLVKEGQILCIIEAMKLMNEIESKVAGRVMKICVDNAHGVEYGQPLFVIDPAR